MLKQRHRHSDFLLLSLEMSLLGYEEEGERDRAQVCLRHSLSGLPLVLLLCFWMSNCFLLCNQQLDLPHPHGLLIL